MSAGGLWTVLPVKAWAEAKRRLSPVLSGEERQELARCMLDDLLGAIGGAARVTGVLAVTSDRVAGEYLARAGCELLPEPRRGLNLALGTAAGGTEAARGFDDAGLADRPAPRDLDGPRRTLRRTIQESRQGAAGQRAPRATVTVAPDRFRSGTNALACSPPGCIPFRFGDGSFHAHLREAERSGAAASSLELDGLSLDVDHPDDLAELLRRDSSSRSARFLNAIGTAKRLGTC